MAVEFDKLFDIDESVSDLNKAINAIEKLGSVYKNTLSQMTTELSEMTKAQKDLVKAVEETQKGQKKLDVTTEKGRQEAGESAKQTEVQKEQYLFLTKQIKDLEGNIKALKSEENKFNKSREETLKNNKEIINLNAKLIALESKEAQEIANLKTKIQEKNKALKESAKESLGLVTLFEKERKKLRELKNEYKNVAKQFGVNSKEAKKLKNNFQKLDKEIKEIDQSAGDFQSNVGNYPELFESMGGGMAVASTGTKSLNTGFKALLANPMGLALVAIVGAVGLLFKAFKSLTGGAATLEKITSALTITFDTLFTRIGKVLSGELSLWEFMTETTTAIAGQISVSNQLIDLRRELQEDTAALTLSEAKYGEAIAKLSAIRDDDTKSLKEQEKAARDFLKATQGINQERLFLSEREEAAALKELKTVEESGEKKRLAQIKYTEALAKAAQVRAQVFQEEADAERALALIIRDRFEQELDLLLDLDDRKKNINEREIADEKTTQQRKQELLKENFKLIEESFADQIQLFRKYYGVQIDGVKLLKLSGKELTTYTNTIGLNEIAVNRLREVTIDQQSANRDNIDSIRDVNKGMKKQIVLSDELKNILSDNAKDREKLDKDLQDKGKASWKDYYDNITQKAKEAYEASTQFLRDNVLSTIEGIQESVTRIAQIFGEALNNFVNIQVGTDQRKINELQANRERDLELAGDNADERAAIEQRFDTRIEALERKQANRKRKIAIFEKALAVTNSIINTATAVVQALPNIPKSILMGILGGIRTAAILAQPIPQYAKGTDFHKGGLAVVGDGGKSEMVTDPSGKRWMSPSKSTLIDLPRGSKVMDGITTQMMLNHSQGLANRALSIGNDKGVTVNVPDMSEDIVRAIKNKPVPSFDFVRGRFVENLRKGNTTHLDWDGQNTF